VKKESKRPSIEEIRKLSKSDYFSSSEYREKLIDRVYTECIIPAGQHKMKKVLIPYYVDNLILDYFSQEGYLMHHGALGISISWEKKI